MILSQDNKIINKKMKGCENLNNIEIRLEMAKAGLKQWQVADLVGITEQALSKKLRKELPAEEQQRIIKTIKSRMAEC